MREALTKAQDELGAQEDKNGAIKAEVLGKLHKNAVISARQKVKPADPSPPPFEDHGIKKYKSRDYAEKIELENYQHQIDKVKRAISAEKAKQKKYEDASKAADEIIKKT